MVRLARELSQAAMVAYLGALKPTMIIVIFALPFLRFVRRQRPVMAGRAATADA